MLISPPPDLMQNIDFLHLICHPKLNNGENGALENRLQRWMMFNIPNHHNPQRLKPTDLRGNYTSYPIYYLLSSRVMCLSLKCD